MAVVVVSAVLPLSMLDALAVDENDAAVAEILLPLPPWPPLLEVEEEEEGG